MSFKDKVARKNYYKEYDKNRYTEHKADILQRNRRRKQEVASWFRMYKSTLYCMDCGISHLAVLQFHHREPTKKSFTISNVVRRAYGVKRIMEEIAKCDVLCVNCHAKRHWREKHETDSWEEVVPSEE